MYREAGCNFLSKSKIWALNYCIVLLQAVQNNGTLYVHAVFLPSGLSLDPADEDFDRSAILVKSHRKLLCIKFL